MNPREETYWCLHGYTPIHADLDVPFLAESLCWERTGQPELRHAGG